MAIGFAVIDAGHREMGVQHIPMAGLVGMDRSAGSGAGLNELHAIGLAAHDSSQGAALALAAHDDDAALAGLVFCQAAVNAVLGIVGRADVTAEVSAINLDLSVERVASRLGRKSLTELVSQNECRLVLTVQGAGKLHHRHALGGVHGDADRRQHVSEVHLAGSEDGAGRDRELVTASLALELAARGDLVSVQSATTRANGGAVRLVPAELAEHHVSLGFAALEDFLEGQGAGGG